MTQSYDKNKDMQANKEEERKGDDLIIKKFNPNDDCKNLFKEQIDNDGIYSIMVLNQL
jgi:hypothetical protein